jgi:hypothetical protein
MDSPRPGKSESPLSAVGCHIALQAVSEGAPALTPFAMGDYLTMEEALQDRWRIVFHESGHGTAALRLLNWPSVIVFVPNVGGQCVYRGGGGQVDTLERALVVRAGRAAERLALVYPRPIEMPHIEASRGALPQDVADAVDSTMKRTAAGGEFSDDAQLRHWIRGRFANDLSAATADELEDMIRRDDELTEAADSLIQDARIDIYCHARAAYLMGYATINARESGSPPAGMAPASATAEDPAGPAGTTAPMGQEHADGK